MDENNRIFKVLENGNGKEVEIYIKSPSLQDNEKAESIRVRRWNQAIDDGAVLTERLNEILKKQGIWSDEKENKIMELRIELAEALDTIDKGGIKLSEAKELAIKVRKLRNEINSISFDRLKYINETVEGQSQNAQFNYLVSQCAVYNDNREKKYFKSYEDFLNRANDLDSYLISNRCADVIFGNNEANWPENKFLKERGFVDDKLRLINKDGHLVDTEGRLVDEFGNWIKYAEDGQPIIVDRDGNPVETIVERKPFLDDEGNPIE
jgi:ribosomal protein S16